MPHLTALDRSKIDHLAKSGNEDAIFFLGQTEQSQKRNYYRGWKILADQDDVDATNRLEDERERLRSNHEQRVAMIAAGVDEGDSLAFAQRDKLKEQARRRQQASRARKKAKQITKPGMRKAAAETDADENQDCVGRAEIEHAADNCEGGCVQDTEGLLMQNQCSVDDDEPLPTTAHLLRVKEEMEVDLFHVRQLPPWKIKQERAIQTTNKTREKEIELKLEKVNAEIRMAGLEAKKASLELERLQLRSGRVFRAGNVA